MHPVCILPVLGYNEKKLNLALLYKICLFEIKNQKFWGRKALPPTAGTRRGSTPFLTPHTPCVPQFDRLMVLDPPSCF